ncbi:MAG: DUF2934 domain-containing protein [Comamonadaceae bacterium]|nr:MAG: DUF2934 domain-containing protein [Comamonadaceae bacterium]
MAKARSNSISKVQQVLSNKGDAIDEGLDALADVDSVDPRQDAELTRDDRIRLAAYAIAERRGFEGGSETEDWLEAERQVDADNGDGNAADGTR